MTPQKRKELEIRRSKLQEKIEVASFVEKYIHPFVEILQVLKDRQMDFRIATFTNIPSEWNNLLDNTLSENPYALYELNKISRASGNPVIHQLLDHYPGQNAFRYVPDLPLLPPGIGVESFYEIIPSQNDWVYLYYFAYPLLLELYLPDIKKADIEDLFNLWHGDAIIFPKNYEWLLAYSLEEEWRYGKKV